MPCRSDYMEANGRESESKHVCQLLRYLFKAQGKMVPQEIDETAEKYYGNVENLDKDTALLCKMCGEADEKLIYDGRNPEARKLADWWDDHQERDQKRIAKEQAEERQRIAKESALSKLTKEEKEVLGL